MNIVKSYINFLAASYQKITVDSVLESLNPFHGTSQVDDLFSFIMMILRIALGFGGLIGIGFIVLGGYQYITSGGSPEATKKASATLTWAIVGVIIAFTATLIIDFFLKGLGLSPPSD